MRKLKFNSNQEPTVGVEIEVALVDPETGALKSAIGDVLGAVPSKYDDTIKPELMQCYLEVNSATCRTINQVQRDLRAKFRAIEKAADKSGVNLYWSGTHPFSSCHDQIPSPSKRYAKLLELLQDLGRQLVTFGLHVHVGVDSGDKAIIICDRILKHLPTLLALSANSPWWENRITGLQSHRSKVMEMLPTAGLPTPMNNWSEYVWLANHLMDTGFINSIREIWWDVRPHNHFGTVEVRICDTPGCLDDALALAALIQCLVVHLSNEIDFGTYQHDGHPMLIRQNKWRAARYGLDAKIVDGIDYEWKTARRHLAGLVDELRPTAEQLKSTRWLERVGQMAKGRTWAQRQLSDYRRTRSHAKTIARMCAQSRLS